MIKLKQVHDTRKDLVKDFKEVLNAVRAKDQAKLDSLVAKMQEKLAKLKSSETSE